MRNNPFVTLLLLCCVEIMLYVYCGYINFVPFGDWEFSLAFLCFFIPVISVIINFCPMDSSYRKAFRYLTVFMVIVSIIIFIGFSYLLALGKAYQH
ncbi:hypothetical protein [Chryseobacterium potabilaquae]|uniref:Uncharacterized protein n=1 Tax=Chryseobacterium potabilaquae TaxID=2675057 RepID=A0A6N4X884_9FLAO|nr:hypothetical protein [Chryseobacterium potabilaquae]CAA7194469.1 hypothetical protein CHRY9293_00781 [Chryseobacterium potabilaquae]